MRCKFCSQENLQLMEPTDWLPPLAVELTSLRLLLLVESVESVCLLVSTTYSKSLTFQWPDLSNVKMSKMSDFVKMSKMTKVSKMTKSDISAKFTNMSLFYTSK